MDGYAPGWSDDAVTMLRRRSAAERAASALAHLTPGTRVLDVGCGPGSITVGLARAVGPTGIVVGVDRAPSQVALARTAVAGAVNARFVQASVYALPLPDGAVDVAFAHALFEHLARPADALAELRRVVRGGGLVALTSSDWSRARLEPRDDDVERALRLHFRLRRRAGGEPFAGRRLAELARASGLTGLRVEHEYRVDLGYADLARYVGTRIEAALRDAPAPVDRAELLAAAAAARRWSARTGVFEQCWVEAVARVP